MRDTRVLDGINVTVTSELDVFNLVEEAIGKNDKIYIAFERNAIT
jgi:hypothetical protein